MFTARLLLSPDISRRPKNTEPAEILGKLCLLRGKK